MTFPKRPVSLTDISIQQFCVGVQTTVSDLEPTELNAVSFSLKSHTLMSRAVAHIEFLEKQTSLLYQKLPRNVTYSDKLDITCVIMCLKCHSPIIFFPVGDYICHLLASCSCIHGNPCWALVITASRGINLISMRLFRILIQNNVNIFVTPIFETSVVFTSLLKKMQVSLE